MMWRQVVRSGQAATAAALIVPDRAQAAVLVHRRWLAGVGLMVALGLALRLVGLWPPSTNAAQAPFDDEGVYTMAAQLLRQGVWPYRDYFFAHPPLGIVTLLPAVSLSYSDWGSSLSFGLARLLMVGVGSATILLVGLAAGRIWGGAGGVVAAGLLALDPSSVTNSRHVMLEVPMTFLIAGALLASAAGRPRAGLLGGALVGLAGLVKVQAWLLGLAAGLCLVASRRWPAALQFTMGLVVVPLALAPFLLVAGPDGIFRQVVLFQILRPPDGLTSLSERLSSLLAPTGLLFGLLGGAGGLVLAWVIGVRPARQVAPIVLWVGLALLSFLLSRSYYQHYASQVMPGLAVLAGGLGAAWSRLAGRGVAGWGLALATAALASGMISILVQHVQAEPESLFTTVARYVEDAVPPGTPVLTTDAQFNLLASRPLPKAEGAYLVDSYGQLIYAGLGLGQGTLVEAVQRASAVRDGATVHEVMWRPAAQTLFLDQASEAQVVVVHAVGRSRMTAETAAWLGRHFTIAEETRRYTIYRRDVP